jgi:hypothetical protein
VAIVIRVVFAGLKSVAMLAVGLAAAAVSLAAAFLFGQIAASAPQMDALLGRRPPSICSPRTSAYSSASQYTSNVTTTEITSAVVDTCPPAVSRIAAVTMAPYIPAARRPGYVRDRDVQVRDPLGDIRRRRQAQR